MKNRLLCFLRKVLTPRVKPVPKFDGTVGWYPSIPDYEG